MFGLETQFHSGSNKNSGNMLHSQNLTSVMTWWAVWHVREGRWSIVTEF